MLIKTVDMALIRKPLFFIHHRTFREESECMNDLSPIHSHCNGLAPIKLLWEMLGTRRAVTRYWHHRRIVWCWLGGDQRFPSLLESDFELDVVKAAMSPE